MALYNISEKKLITLEKTSFTIERLQERYDLQEAIKKNVDIRRILECKVMMPMQKRGYLIL